MTRELPRRTFSIKRFVVKSILLIFAPIIIGIIFTALRPVKWDAGACSGGYGTYIFDKYSEELTAMFIAESGGDVISASALRGTQSADWDGRTIYLQFDMEFTNSDSVIEVQSVSFEGRRVWTDTYLWNSSAVTE